MYSSIPGYGTGSNASVASGTNIYSSVAAINLSSGSADGMSVAEGLSVVIQQVQVTSSLLYSTTSSYQVTQSLTLLTESSSFASSSISASYALTASYALNGGGSGGNGLATGSTYPFTSSWSENAVSASYAPSGAAFGLETGSTYPFTASRAVTASFSISASYWNSSSVATILNNKQNRIATGSLLPVTSSWARNALTASVWESGSIISRIDTLYTDKQNNIATGSTLPVTASWSLNAPQQAGTMETGSTYPITASAAVSASWAPSQAAGSGLATGSTYPFTSSWAVSSVSAVSASYWDDSGIQSSITNLQSSKQNNLATGSLVPVTSSWAEFAISASWAPSQAAGSGLATGSQYPFTSSHSITASYWNSSSIAAELNERQHNIATGSTMPVTASWATNSISASYWNSSSVATRIDTLYTNKQNNLATGSTVPVTSSWALNAISASYAPSDFVQNGLATGSTYPITSSWSENVISASYWNSSSVATRIDTLYSNKQNNIATGSVLPVTASWASNYPAPTGLATGSTYPITASWAVSASWAPSQAAAGGLETGSTYPITSSWAVNSISASYWNSSSVATILNNKQFRIATGSNMPVTASWANTASIIVCVDNSDDGNRFLPWVAASTGNPFISSGVFRLNPGNGSLTASVFAGNLTGTASYAAFTATSSVSAASASYISGSMLFSGKTSGHIPIWTSGILSPTSSITVANSSINLNQGSGSVVGSYGAAVRWTVAGSTATTKVLKNGTLTRLARGQYSYIFVTDPQTSDYIVSVNAVTGSGATFIATASNVAVTAQTTDGFTMSFQVPGAVYTDPVTASMVCFFV
jgi:hypothetical protein